MTERKSEEEKDMSDGSEFYNRGDRVLIAESNGAPAGRGSVDHDLGGAVVHVLVDGKDYGIRRRNPDPIPRGAVSPIEVDENGYDVD